MADYTELNLSVHPSYWIYRMWAEDGTCLYVGRTTSWVKRVAAHLDANRNRKEGRLRETWYEEIVRIDVAEFASRAEAIAEEVAQIQALQPRENRILKGERVYSQDRMHETMRQYSRERYKSDPEVRDKILKQSTAWKEANRERFNEIARNSYHKRKAEISDDERQRKLDLHNAAVRRWRQRRKEEAS